jgi:pyruvate formate lyase activating enzyme
MDVAMAMEKIERDIIFFDSSGGGVTFSGGEPLAQPRFLTALLKECRKREIHTAVDTSGFAPLEVMEEVAGLCDLILFDLKIIDGIEHQRRTGVKVGPILENLNLIANMDVAVRLRMPLVPGITSTDANVNLIIDLLGAKGRLRTIDLLPFHRTADAKYQRLGITNPMENIAEPDPKIIESIKQKFMNNGFNVSLGG